MTPSTKQGNEAPSLKETATACCQPCTHLHWYADVVQLDFVKLFRQLPHCCISLLPHLFTDWAHLQSKGNVECL